MSYTNTAARRGPPETFFSAVARQNLPRLRSAWRNRLEFQRHTVHAIAQARRRRPVIEDVTEMALASAAMHLGAGHEERTVGRCADSVRQGLVETRPAGAAFELRIRGKQRKVAAG